MVYEAGGIRWTSRKDSTGVAHVGGVCIGHNRNWAFVDQQLFNLRYSQAGIKGCSAIADCDSILLEADS